jgi:hypothetical protein
MYNLAMSDTQDREDPPLRLWQIALTGNGRMPNSQTREALGQILDLFPDVGSLVVRTVDGSYHATRDFPGDSSEKVDQLLAAVFNSDPTVMEISFPKTPDRLGHTATPDNPYCSAAGKDCARIRAAAARGELTTEEAIAAYAQAISFATPSTARESIETLPRPSENKRD